MNPKLVFLLTLFSVLSISTPASAQQEEITLSTYYPAPFGEYDELCAEKLLVDTPSAAELQDMARGDCHITRSLIIGQGGTGFSYDELSAVANLPDNGDVLIRGNVGIGTPEPDGVLHIERDGAAGTTLLHLTGNSEEYAGLRVRIGGGNAAGAQDYFEITGRPSYAAGVGSGGDIRILRWHNPYPTSTGNLWLMPDGGNVGIGTTGPIEKLHISDGNIRLRRRDGSNAYIFIDAPTGRESSLQLEENGTRMWSLWNNSSDDSFRITNNTGTALTILSNGNVGIGTTSPAEKLDVNGAIKVGNTATTNAGSIRWTGSAFQGYNGSSWNPLGTRGWVNFDGTGADGTNMTIRESSNVASVYKNSSGDYTINWAIPFANANYCLSGLASGDISGDSRVVAIISLSAGSARIVIRNTGGSKSNTSLITVMAIG